MLRPAALAPLLALLHPLAAGAGQADDLPILHPSRANQGPPPNHPQPATGDLGVAESPGESPRPAGGAEAARGAAKKEPLDSTRGAEAADDAAEQEPRDSAGRAEAAVGAEPPDSARDAPVGAGWSDAGRGVTRKADVERRRREASARLAAGDPEEAIAHCEPVIARLTACRLLVASAALDLRRWALAESAVRPARGSLGPLEPWGALLLGEALAGAGKAAEAVPLLDEARRADPTGPLGDRAEPAEALALLRSGRAVQARSILSRLVSKRRDDRDELRLALAEATLAAGDRAGAASLLRTIWIEAAGRPASEVARERLDALAADGAGIPAPTSAERLDRATRLLDRGESRRAEHEIADVPSSVEPIRRTWLLARALSDQDRKDEAETLLAPLLAALPTGDPNAHDLLELAARLAMRRGDAKEAIARLDRIQAGSSGQRAASADFLAAFFLYDDGRFEEAERRFRSHLAEHPGHRADESLWYVGWSSFKAGDFAGARKSFAALEAKHPNSSLAPQAHYWQAKAAERAGDAQGAVALYRKTAARWPGEWYGALARQRLEMPLRPAGLPPGRAAPARPKVGGATGARLARAEALFGAGLSREAGLELDAALGGSRDRALLTWAAFLAADSGDPARAHRLGVLRLGGLRGAPELAYPLAFQDEVREAADRFGVDPAFVWSIMRQESGFRPAVRSPAAAVGLMQLRGITAEKLGTMLGLPPGQEDRLEDPRTNITLGTYYLYELQKRFGGSLALAAAAYNAGPSAVVRWLEDPTRRSLPLDEFVESIPYRETRLYVKAVIANVLAYRSIHGGDPVPLPSKLPPVSPGVDF